MEKKTNRNYTEVSLEVNGYDRNYRNPLTKTYCYEYALYRAVSELFASVVCESRLIDSLNLYFAELPDGSETDGNGQKASGKTRTKADYIKEAGELVKRDVIGHVTFPMMNICAAKAQTFTEEDGTHTFLFTDGIYGFSVHMEAPSKGRPEAITVKDLHTGKNFREEPGQLKNTNEKLLIVIVKNTNNIRSVLL
ncbi:MAG: hypothetical protein IK139_07375 [Lachnospiraceae bacterium]|nr:hypothetical protein [Lachnospiraceae bacterium]